MQDTTTGLYCFCSNGPFYPWGVCTRMPPTTSTVILGSRLKVLLKTVKWSYHYAACPQSSNLFLNWVISNCTNKTEQQYAWILSSVHSKQWSKTPQYPTYTNLRAGLVNTQIGIMVLCSWMECPTKAQDTAQHKVICYIWSEQKDTSIFYMHNWKNLHRLRKKTFTHFKSGKVVCTHFKFF